MSIFKKGKLRAVWLQSPSTKEVTKQYFDWLEENQSIKIVSVVCPTVATILVTYYD